MLSRLNQSLTRFSRNGVRHMANYPQNISKSLNATFELYPLFFLVGSAISGTSCFMIYKLRESLSLHNVEQTNLVSN